MREQERDGLVLALALAAGSVDAWSYFGVAKVFTANLTGNTVFLGVALAGSRHQIINPLVSIGFYSLGVMLGSGISSAKREDQLWPRRVSVVLTIEGLLLAVTGWLWAWHYPMDRQGNIWPRVLLGLAAFALGMQSGAMQKLKIPGIVTTYITGTWTTLMAGLGRFITGKPRPANSSSRLQWEERLLMQAAVLAVYCFSATLTYFVFKTAPRVTVAISMAAVLFVAAYGAVRGDPESSGSEG